MVNLLQSFRRLRQRIASRRGNVAMLAALLIPAMTGATGLGIEVSYWSLQQIELQHIADAASLAAMTSYNGGSTAQVAANAAADIAELNSIPGAATRTWDSGTNTLTDNLITVKRVTGIRNASNYAFQTSITQSVPLVIAQLVTNLTSVTVAAVGYAETLSSSVSGCLLLTGNSGTTLSMQNGASVNESGCATQTNGSVSITGGANLTTGGLSAAGSITISNGASITGTYKANAGTVTDPYASDTATQNALTAAASASGSAINYGGASVVTISPGSYSSMTLSNGAKLTLNPGLYLIHGQINLSGGATLTGTGVTLVFTDQMSVSNGVVVTLSAPLAGAAAGVPGVAILSSSSQDIALNGGASFNMTGVLYYPNGHIEADNGFGTSGATCSIVVAKTITINGGAKFANNCTSSSGVKDLPVPVGASVVSLVK